MKFARVLVADDNREMRSWLREIFEAQRATVEEAHSGAELARRLMHEGPFDLVVGDVRMSWATGLQVLEMARAAGNAVPFLVITGFADEAVRERARQLGAELMEKPFEAEQLVERARRMLPPLLARVGAAGPLAPSRLARQPTGS
jgi:CheY-like chemotaxis protein